MLISPIYIIKKYKNSNNFMIITVTFYNKLLTKRKKIVMIDGIIAYNKEKGAKWQREGMVDYIIKEKD